MPVTWAVIISLWVINDGPCEPAVEMQALKMSQSLLPAAPAVTCLGWVLDCEHSPSTTQVSPCGLCRERVGEGRQQTTCGGCGTGNLSTLCSVSVALRVSAAEMAEIRDWTLLRLCTGTFRNY